MSRSKAIRVERWTGGTPPSEQEAEARLGQEGYESFVWNDVPGAAYPRHRHDYDECLWIIRGEITFTIDGQEHHLKAGDRLYLPAGIPHTASVPPQRGVTYLVGQLRT